MLVLWRISPASVSLWKRLTKGHLLWKHYLKGGGWDEEAAGRITTLLLLPINSLPQRFAHLHIFLSSAMQARKKRKKKRNLIETKLA